MGDDLEIASRLRNLASAWGGLPLLLKAADRLEALAGPMEREGWVLVPAAPDTAWLTTIEAAASAQWGDTDTNHHRGLRIRAALLSAAPKPEAAG